MNSTINEIILSNIGVFSNVFSQYNETIRMMRVLCKATREASRAAFLRWYATERPYPEEVTRLISQNNIDSNALSSISGHTTLHVDITSNTPDTTLTYCLTFIFQFTKNSAPKKKRGYKCGMSYEQTMLWVRSSGPKHTKINDGAHFKWCIKPRSADLRISPSCTKRPPKFKRNTYKIDNNTLVVSTLDVRSEYFILMMRNNGNEQEARTHILDNFNKIVDMLRENDLNTIHLDKYLVHNARVLHIDVDDVLIYKDDDLYCANYSDIKMAQDKKSGRIYYDYRSTWCDIFNRMKHNKLAEYNARIDSGAHARDSLVKNIQNVIKYGQF